MRLHALFAFTICTAMFLAGCSLYKSSDRDFFDGNAVVGAPKKNSSALRPLSLTCTPAAELDADSMLGLDLDENGDGARVERLSGQQTVRVIITHRSSSQSGASICRFDFAPTEVSDADLIVLSRSLVE